MMFAPLIKWRGTCRTWATSAQTPTCPTSKATRLCTSEPPRPSRAASP